MENDDSTVGRAKLAMGRKVGSEYAEFVAGRYYCVLNAIGSGISMVFGIVLILAIDRVDQDPRTTRIVGVFLCAVPVIGLVAGLIAETYGRMCQRLQMDHGDAMKDGYDRVRRWVFSDRLAMTLKIAPWAVITGLVVAGTVIKRTGGEDYLQLFVMFTLLLCAAVLKLGHMWVCLARRMMLQIDKITEAR